MPQAVPEMAGSPFSQRLGAPLREIIEILRLTWAASCRRGSEHRPAVPLYQRLFKNLTSDSTHTGRTLRPGEAFGYQFSRVIHDPTALLTYLSHIELQRRDVLNHHFCAGSPRPSCHCRKAWDSFPSSCRLAGLIRPRFESLRPASHRHLGQAWRHGTLGPSPQAGFRPGGKYPGTAARYEYLKLTTGGAGCGPLPRGDPRHLLTLSTTQNIS